MRRVQVIVQHLSAQRPSSWQAARGVRLLSTQPVAGGEAEAAPVRITPHSNGCLTLSLHRPKALNALNLPMVRLLQQGLKSVSTQKGAPGSKCVLVYGEGEKALCAGGDIRALAFPSDPKEPPNFFREEYTLNHAISQCPSPYVSILRGITMGGGVGISVHGSVRIITDNTMFAMPETGIGLFPDVGGTYFLPRLPGALGMFLALTGQSLGAADAMYAGVGTHFIPLARIADFIADMESSSDPLAALLDKYTTPVPPTKPEAKLQPFLQQRRAVIDRIFSADSYDAVLQRLRDEAQNGTGDEAEKKWINDTIKLLSTKSPTSLMITFHAVQEGRAAPSLASALATELRLGARITSLGAQGDFAEGVKAVLIDKKHKPQWKPKPTLQQVQEFYFAPFKKEEAIDELKL